MSKITAGAPHFLSIPIELRLMIYANVFNAAPYNILTVPSTYRIPGLPLLRTNHQIYDEANRALAQIYKVSQFRVNETPNFPVIAQFISSISPQAAAAITDLSLDWTTIFPSSSQLAASNAVRHAYYPRNEGAWEVVPPHPLAVSLPVIEDPETTHSNHQVELSNGGFSLTAILQERVTPALIALPRFTGLRYLTLLLPDFGECDMMQTGTRWDCWYREEYLKRDFWDILKPLDQLKGVKKLVIGNTVDYCSANRLAKEMKVEEVVVLWWGRECRRMSGQGDRRLVTELNGWRFQANIGGGTGVRTMGI